MFRFLSLTVLAVACLCLFAPPRADAGPVRNFIAKHRPGLIVPKKSQTCPCPNCPGGGGEPSPAPIVDPGLDIGPSPYPQGAGSPPGTHYYLPISQPVIGGCPGGRCPVPRK